MPTKKSSAAKKKPTRKRTRRETPPSPMPSLIFKEGRLPPRISTENTTRETEQIAASIKTDKQSVVIEKTGTFPVFQTTPREQTARRWMWLGVISMSAIIFLLWGWALFIRMSEVKLSRAPEFDLANKTKKDWDHIFSDQKQAQTEKEVAKEKIRQVLAQLMAQSSAASSEQATSTITTTSTKTLNSKP